MNDQLGPMECWKQAHEEFPDDAERLRERFVELMEEHGHLIPKPPGWVSPLLPCGWDPRNRGGDQDARPYLNPAQDQWERRR